MSKKLLLADDSITIQKVIGITFAHEDYQLSVVDNGDAALQKARETHPDLILADVLMPGMNGYDLCAAVKQDPLLKAVPVLLLAGTFEPFDEAKAKEVAADSWIAKPFSSQALIDQVQTLLQQAGQQQEEAPQDIGLEDVAEILDTPAVESDIWAEVAEPSADAETSFADISMDLDQPPATEASVDEAWGDVSFAEDDLAKEEETPLDEGGWDAIDEEAVESPLTVEEELSVELPKEETPEPVAEDELMPLEEDELLLNEEPLPEPIEEVSGDEEFFELQEEDILELDDEDILVLEEDGDEVEEVAEVSAGIETVDDDLLAVEDELLLTEDMAVSPLSVEEEDEPVMPAVAAPPLTEEVVAKQTGGLSEAQLEAIVERVVGRVVEELANKMVEKVAWEVVPDLAESMIKDEIHKIKQGAGEF